MTDWRHSDLSEVDRAICAYVEKLTLAPATTTQQDVDALRTVGLSDQAIHDLCQVASYFAYINRIADGLGIDLEPEMSKVPPWSENAR